MSFGVEKGFACGAAGGLIVYKCRYDRVFPCFSQEKEASLLRSLESANLAALTATRQALPALPHPLALRSLLSGVMSGATAVRENLVARTQARHPAY